MLPSWAQNTDPLCFTATADGTTTIKLRSNGGDGKNNFSRIQLRYKIGNDAENYFVGRDNGGNEFNEIKLTKGQQVKIYAASTNQSFSSSAGYQEFDKWYNYSSNYQEWWGRVISGFRTTCDTITGNYYYFVIDKDVECSGNVTSLLNKNGTATVPDYAFVGLFRECSHLLSAPELPATTLGEYCYYGMFFECSNLALAPILPAETLKNWCYAYMFMGCSKLQYIEVGFTGWHPNATTYWAKDVQFTTPQSFKEGYNYVSSFSSNGIFKSIHPEVISISDLNGESNKSTRYSRVPSGWSVEEYNKDYLTFTWNGNYTDANNQTWIPEGLHADIFFKKVGTPNAVQLEYSFNGRDWEKFRYTEDQAYITIKYGKSVMIRCGDENGYSTLSKDKDNYYYFETKFFEPIYNQYDGSVRVTEVRKGASYDYIDYDGRSQQNNMDNRPPKAGTEGIDYDFKEGNQYYWYRYYRYNRSYKPDNDTNKGTNMYKGILGVHGNVMSLLDRNLIKTDVGSYCFYRLFSGPNGNSMRNIFTLPNLPAVDLAPNCYEEMFKGCIYVKSAPYLPATSELLEESSATDCYKNMFNGCKALNMMKVGFDKWELTNGKEFTTNWVSGVETTKGTFQCPSKLPLEYGPSRIPWSDSEGVGEANATEDWLCLSTSGDFATIKLDKSNSALNQLDGHLEYSFDGKTWYSYIWSNTAGKAISLERKTGNTKIFFRSNLTDKSGRCSESTDKYYHFTIAGNVEASGNVMSLLHKNCYRYDVKDYEFYKLFDNCTSLQEAPTLQATALGAHCYESMFNNCKALVTPPELPAINLKESCYSHMFDGCIVMTSVPDLEATSLANGCYEAMFLNCSKIQTAPVLPATDLVKDCYKEMFKGCSSLSYMNINFTEWNEDNNATTDWVDGVKDKGVFVCPTEIYSAQVFGISRIPHKDEEGKKWIVQENTKTSLYFEAKRNSSTIQLNKVKSPYDAHLIYSTDDGLTWKDYTWTNEGQGLSIQLNKVGTNRVYFKAGKMTSNDALDVSYVANEKFSTSESNFFVFNMRGSFNAHGNIMSLLSQDGNQDIVPDYAFTKLFRQCKQMHTAPTFPAITMGKYSYFRLFEDCWSLETAPDLPATTLAEHCYNYMFLRCFNLKQAPKLLAKDLKNDCYNSMFLCDTNLITAPHLPAETLQPGCYTYMFAGCSNLNHISISFKNWNKSATNCWVADYESYPGPKDNGIFMCPEELPHAINANPSNFGDSRIPRADVDGRRWKVNVSALRFTALNASQIALKKVNSPADVTFEYSVDNAVSWHPYTLGEVIDLKTGEDFYFRAAGVYNRLSTSQEDYYQFSTIGALSVEGNIMCMLDSLARGTSVANYTFYHLFDGCEGLNNAPEMPATTVGEYAYAYMFKGCNGLTEVDTLRATNLSANCYRGMFTNCINLKTAPGLPATNLANYCYAAMFNGCTNLKNASELPATTLKEGCYQSMFYGCSSLQIAPELPATTLATKCYNQMFYSCSRLSEISVNFSKWNPTDATENWVNGVSDEGIFSCPTDLDTTKFDANRVPKDTDHKWIINPDFLGFKAKTDVTITLNRVGAPDTVMLIYAAKSKSKWLPYTWNGQNGYKIQLKAGESVYFKAEYDQIEVEDENHNITYRNNTFSKDSANYYQFAVTGTAAVTGNVAYLLRRTNMDEVVPAYGFYRLFKDCEGLISAPEVSPVTSIANAHCYESMFEGCSNITNAPSKLPATVLSEACYKNMFKGCASISTIPSELPVVDLEDYCYEGMFEGCESITTAPTLPIDNPDRAVGCYKAMFKNCKSLTDNIPSKLEAGWGLQPYCFESMFEGCESLTKTPELPTSSTLLVEGCYKAMFKGCTSLVSSALPTLPANVMRVSCYESMFEGCTGLTTPATQYEIPDPWNAYTLADSCFKNMYKGCTKLTSTPNTFNNELKPSCFEGMFEGCTSLTKVPSLAQSKLAPRCYYRMFAGCTNLRQAPELPAKKDQLQDSCYAYMFNGCKRMTYMDVAFNEWRYDDLGATHKWVENVAKGGTFMCPDGLDKIFDESHIPYGWSAEDNGDYLCFTSKTTSWVDFQLKAVGKPYSISYKYSTDKKNWTSVEGGVYAQMMGNVQTGTTVYIKITEGRLSKDANNYWYFTCDAPVTVSGNITSLLDPSMEQTDVPDYSFYKLFSGCSQIYGIPDLKMPATEVGAYAYANMFDGCTYLQNNSTVAPELPAMNLGAYCYQNLFKGWKQLKTAPELPATTLAEGCYSNMFNGCASLKNVSALPANVLVEHCYESMFDGCSALNKLNVAFTKWEPASATTNWVRGVADEGEFTCPWALADDAIRKHSDIINAYGPNLIPKNADHPWLILLVTEMSFNYKTGLLSIDGRNPITYSTDPTLSIDNREVGTTVNESSTKVDLNAWLNDKKKPGLDSITYYAISGESLNNGKIIPGVNSVTIYRYPREMGMCVCDNATRIKEGIYYANKVSSPDYPVKIFIPDDTYTIDETLVVKDSTISIIGESLTGTILQTSAPNGVFDITGDDIYLQDLQLVNTASGAAFTNRSLNTTLNIALGDHDYYLSAPGGIEHRSYYLPEEWNRAADTTQATIDHVDMNGSTMSITPGVNNTGHYLVRVDDKYVFASTPDFYILESIEGKNVTVRAANPRGGLGEPVTPSVVKAEGTEYTGLTIKLNSLGFASFSFDDDMIDQLQVIGASVYKGVYHKGDVYLTRMNDYDIVPRRTGVVLVGVPNATLHLYKSNKDIDMDPYKDVTGDNIPLLGNYSDNTIQRTANDGKYYYVLSGNQFHKLSDKGTIRPNKAYFDLTNKVDGNVDYLRIIFGMWSDEEVTGIDYLPTVAENDNYYYTLSGIKTTAKKGLVIEGNKVVLKK